MSKQPGCRPRERRRTIHAFTPAAVKLPAVKLLKYTMSLFMIGDARFLISRA